jgi:hypothetical protein
VDVRTRRLIGWVVAAVGAAIAIVGGLADQIGLGGEGVDEFGSKQLAAVGRRRGARRRRRRTGTLAAEAGLIKLVLPLRIVP